MKLVYAICLASFSDFLHAQNRDYAIDSVYVYPVNEKFVLSKDSFFCNNNKTIWNVLLDSLKYDGLVFTLETDDWYFENTYLFQILNKAYRTKIFDKVICSKHLYYSRRNMNIKEDWIQIKEWSFKHKVDAEKANDLILNSEFVSDYFGPRNWTCVLKDNNLYFLCGGSTNFWNNNHVAVKNRITSIER